MNQMLITLKKRLRHILHQIYYYRASKKRVEFAMTCKDATSFVDVRSQPKTASGRLRLFLHFSVCQSCANYKKLSNVLAQSLKTKAKAQARSQDLTELNQELMKRFEKKPVS